MAKDGDPVAMRLMVERILPPRNLRQFVPMADVSSALTKIFEDVSSAELTTEEGMSIANLDRGESSTVGARRNGAAYCDIGEGK